MYLALALDQGEHGFFLGRGAECAVLGFAADVGFVGFDNLVLPTHGVRVGITHGFANTVRHEPGSLVGHAEHAVHLVCAHAFLAGGHEVRGKKPFVKRDMRALEQSSDRDRELFTASTTMQQPGGTSLAT